MAWRVVVDQALCQGHGVCEAEAPEVFVVAKANTVEVLTPQPEDQLRRAVELAVKYCPTHALSIIEIEATATTGTNEG